MDDVMDIYTLAEKLGLTKEETAKMSMQYLGHIPVVFTPNDLKYLSQNLSTENNEVEDKYDDVIYITGSEDIDVVNQFNLENLTSFDSLAIALDKSINEVYQKFDKLYPSKALHNRPNALTPKECVLIIEGFVDDEYERITKNEVNDKIKFEYSRDIEFLISVVGIVSRKHNLDKLDILSIISKRM